MFLLAVSLCVSAAVPLEWWHVSLSIPVSVDRAKTMSANMMISTSSSASEGIVSRLVALAHSLLLEHWDKRLFNSLSDKHTPLSLSFSRSLTPFLHLTLSLSLHSSLLVPSFTLCSFLMQELWRPALHVALAVTQDCACACVHVVHAQ